jgi:hypothetical protein
MGHLVDDHFCVDDSTSCRGLWANSAAPGPPACRPPQGRASLLHTGILSLSFHARRAASSYISVSSFFSHQQSHPSWALIASPRCTAISYAVASPRGRVPCALGLAVPPRSPGLARDGRARAERRTAPRLPEHDRNGDTWRHLHLYPVRPTSGGVRREFTA